MLHCTFIESKSHKQNRLLSMFGIRICVPSTLFSHARNGKNSKSLHRSYRRESCICTRDLCYGIFCISSQLRVLFTLVNLVVSSSATSKAPSIPFQTKRRSYGSQYFFVCPCVLFCLCCQSVFFCLCCLDRVRRAARRGRYEASAPAAPESGSAAVYYGALESQRRVSGSFSGGHSGDWLGLNCSLVPNATQEDLAAWCLWSPQTNRASVLGRLNKSRASLDLSSFSGPQGLSDFCYGEAGRAGSYIYTYSPGECAALGLPCAADGVVEQGTYQGTGSSGAALSVLLDSTVLYAGAWVATSGPGQGRPGSALYAAVAGGDDLSLLGFYCAYGAEGQGPPRRIGCFREAYALNTRPAACTAGVGEWSAALLAAAIVPGAIVALALAAAAWSACSAVFGKVEDESDRLLRAKAAELRARLRITRADGFGLSSDPPPAWWRPWQRSPRGVVYLHRSGLEAAARLGLWEDFDIDQVSRLPRRSPPCAPRSFGHRKSPRTAPPSDGSGVFGSLPFPG